MVQKARARYAGGTGAVTAAVFAHQQFKESLIYSAIPAIQGSIAIFKESNSLKMKESENRVFRFPCSEKSRMDLFRASFKMQFRAGAFNVIVDEPVRWSLGNHPI